MMSNVQDFADDDSSLQISPTKSDSLHLESKKRKATTLHDSDDDEGFIKQSGKNKKKKKKVDLMAAKTSFFAKMMSDLKAKEEDARKTLLAAEVGMKDHCNCSNLSSEGDQLARTMYLRRLVCVMSVIACWLNVPMPGITDTIKQKVSLQDAKDPKAPAAAPKQEADEHAQAESPQATAPVENELLAESHGMLLLKHPQFFRPCKFMKEFAQEVMDTVTTTEELEKKRLVWQRLLHPLTESCAAFRAAAGDLSKHLVSVQKAVVKAEKKEKDAAEKKAAAAAKEQVDKKQKLIQEKAEQVFFKEVGDKLMDMPRVNVKDALLKDTSFNEPFVLTAENSVVSAWVADGTMVRVMSLYGSRYVKADCMKTEMKHTQPLQPSMGKELTEEMFQKLLANVKGQIADLSPISATWNSTAWLWGCAEKYNDCMFAPNSSGMFKVVISGSVHIYAMKTSALLETLFKQNAGCDRVGHLTNFMLSLKSRDIDVLSKHVPSFQANVAKGETVWLPCGWLLFENVGVAGAYGVRKSIFFKGGAAEHEYREVMKLLQGDGQDVSKMGDIAKLIHVDT